MTVCLNTQTKKVMISIAAESFKDSQILAPCVSKILNFLMMIDTNLKDSGTEAYRASESGLTLYHQFLQQ